MTCSMVALSTVGPGTADIVIIGALALSGAGLGTSSPAMISAVVSARFV